MRREQKPNQTAAFSAPTEGGGGRCGGHVVYKGDGWPGQGQVVEGGAGSGGGGVQATTATRSSALPPRPASATIITILFCLFVCLRLEMILQPFICFFFSVTVM